MWNQYHIAPYYQEDGKIFAGNNEYKPKRMVPSNDHRKVVNLKIGGPEPI